MARKTKHSTCSREGAGFMHGLTFKYNIRIYIIGLSFFKGSYELYVRCGIHIIYRLYRDTVLEVMLMRKVGF